MADDNGGTTGYTGVTINAYNSVGALVGSKTYTGQYSYEQVAFSNFSSITKLVFNYGGSPTIFIDDISYTDHGALPVELVNFSAILINDKINLKWLTATEVNNYGFEIQKKIYNSQLTMNNWEKVGFVKGAGNSNSQKSYSFVDENPTNGKIEYRLKQVDNDGKFKYSKVINIDIKNIPSEFSLGQNYPNPFNPTTKIKFSIPSVVDANFASTTAHVTLIVYNLLGQKVATLVNGELSSGNHSVSFDASKLSSGVYIYRLKAGNNFTAIKKMILMK